MEYKYIKYKTKYLELKGIDTTEQIGAGKQIMFIMFPGFGVSKKGWSYLYEKKKLLRTNFISKLKKIGLIYFHEPLYHNINYYNESNQSKYLYNKNIDFNKDKLDVMKECDKIYENIKDFKGKFIPIGHSIGSYYVYCFEQKYSSKCLFSVIIDGSPIGPIEQTLNDEKYLYPKIDKYIKYNDQMINKLKEKVYEGDKNSAKKLFAITFYNIFSYKKITNKAKKFKKPVIGFYNINIRDDNSSIRRLKADRFFNLNRTKEIEHLKKYNDNYQAITFINKTHYPHFIEESKEIILDYIKQMIAKYKNLA